MRILGIETSCDDTGIAIYDQNKGLLINELFNQSCLHEKYGGIVPEIAAKSHLNKIVYIIKLALKKINMNISDIDGIAYTAGPGLISSLIIGATVGCSLAYALKIPAIAINHIEGHILTPMMETKSLTFPFVVLLVSGGHTELILASSIGKYKLLGKSLDDAAGEALDKTAKLLGLKYPGGPKLSILAQKGITGRYNFPKPMTNQPGMNFSFSGLKTFAANTIRSSISNNQIRADIARAFEDALVETLKIKCLRALNFTNLNRLVISGGVSANKYLRFILNKMMKDRNGEFFCARPEFCTDNGAMIAYTGMLRLKNGIRINSLEISVRAQWPIEELQEIIY